MFKENKSRVCDWKKYPKKSWPYKDDVLNDPKYLKDRAELFASNGDELAPFNGWWWFTPNKIHKPHNNHKIIKRRYKKEK